MDHRRRTFLTAPGEPLILARSASTIAERFVRFAQHSGLPAEQVVTSPLVVQPIPAANRSMGPRGWLPTMNPAALWHPLFWLPERIAHRYRFDDDGQDIESDSEWVVRVGLEVTMSGLYDPADGTWLDILSVHGLDIDDPAVQERVRNWLAGNADETLDSIDLSELTELPDEPHWALASTAELLPTLQPASWALLADDLAQRAGEIAIGDPAEAVEGTATCANLALGVLAGVPPRERDGVAPVAQWQDIVDSLVDETNPETVIENQLDALSESLYAIRDDYWPFVLSLDEEVAAQETAAA